VNSRRTPAQRPGPTGGKRDENRRARTAALAEAALRLFVARGVESVTIDQIVAEAKVAKGSFYRYFKDKQDVLEALLSKLAPEMRSAFDECLASIERAEGAEALPPAYEALARRLAALIFEQPALALLYLSESRGSASGAEPLRALADELVERALALTAAASAHGLLRPVDPRIAAITVVGAVEKLLFETLRGRELGEASSVAQSLISIVLFGLGRSGAADRSG